MIITSKLNNAFKEMDLFIQPSPTLFKRIMILLDKKIMNILYGYNTDDYYTYEFYRMKLPLRRTFLGENNGLKKIARSLNDTDDIISFNNKIVFNKVFAKYLHRDWLPIPECTFDEFCNFCTAHSEFIKKPIDRGRGIGIEKYSISKDSNLLEYYNKLKGENCLIEEIIIQDKSVASFNPHSVNTCRVYSLLNRSKVIIMDAYLRAGIGMTVVDNQCRGGVAAKIDVDTGIITTHGKNKWAKIFHSHPYTNKQFIGFKIPSWAEIKKTIEEAALVIPTVRYIGWDVAMNYKGDICLIEGNDKGSFALQEVIDLKGEKPIYEKLLKDMR